MKQRTLAMMTGFEQYTRKTRRAIFLEEMEQVVPCRELCADLWALKAILDESQPATRQAVA